MQIWRYIFGILVLMLFSLIIALLQLPDSNLHIVACDVGQGDAILMTYKNIQILTDGGPDKKAIDCLGRHLPFWDRTIELIISTHPDADHSTGLIEVVRKYNVGSIFINPIDSGTQTIRALEREVGGKSITIVHPVAGTKYGVGLIHLDIVNPTGQELDALNENIDGSSLGFYKPNDSTNSYSIAYRLDFGKFSGLFPGDIPPVVSDRLAFENSVGPVNYIKIPHHGSKNGLTHSLLELLRPKVAVISVGKNNYGHPSREILDMLTKYNVKVFRTDIGGNIEIVSDGETFWLAN